MTTRCRTCKQPKWRGDICANADCSKAVSPAYRLTARLQTPHTVMVKHGFHAEHVMRQAILDTADKDTLPVNNELPSTATLPYDAIREQRVVLSNTYRWWDSAHDRRDPYHEQFPGYCHKCTNVRVGVL